MIGPATIVDNDERDRVAHLDRPHHHRACEELA